MATIIQSDVAEIFSLEQYVNFIQDNVDLNSDDSLIESASALKALANNKGMLINQLNDFLASPTKMQAGNFYTDNSFILWDGTHNLRDAKKFVLRANVWLQPQPYGGNISWDSIHKAYNIAHNHNFSLLTAGFWGCGYETDIFEIDETKIIGYVDEKVSLTFLNRARLSENTVIFYRRFKDVHVQFPPQEMSISLNLIPYELGKEMAEQYDFDIEKKSISAITHTDVWNRVNLLRMASLVGNVNTYDIIEKFTLHSECPRTRLAALEALVQMKKMDSRVVWELGMSDSSELIRVISKQKLLAIL